MDCLLCLQELLEDGHYGLHEHCFSDWFDVVGKPNFKDLFQKSATSSGSLLSSASSASSFFHGKFKKYSASLADRAFILKMREPEAAELPEVEYLCNQISTVFSIPVAKFFIINFHGDRVFVTENFISHTEATDLVHIYHFLNHMEYTCENLIAVVNLETQKPYFAEILIRTILFDALIGNHDRHGRNIGLIANVHGKILSPIYDNVSYLALESASMLEADFNPCGKIATQHTLEPSMKDYVKELERLGYKSEVKDFYEKLYMGGLETIDKLIDRSFCSKHMQIALKKLIFKRYKELEHGL